MQPSAPRVFCDLAREIGLMQVSSPYHVWLASYKVQQVSSERGCTTISGNMQILSCHPQTQSLQLIIHRCGCVGLCTQSSLSRAPWDWALPINSDLSVTQNTSHQSAGRTKVSCVITATFRSHCKSGQACTPPQQLPLLALLT